MIQFVVVRVSDDFVKCIGICANRYEEVGRSEERRVGKECL